jgi:alkylhydroperoxidase family enzyme
MLDQGKSLLPLPDREDIPADYQHVWDHLSATRGIGGMGNVFRSLFNNPAGLEAMTGVGGFIRLDSGLDDKLRELGIMTTAQVNRCEYEWAHHWIVCEKSGIPEDFIKKIGTPAIESEPAPFADAAKYAAQLAAGDTPSEELTNALIEQLGIEMFVAYTITIAYYGALARFINVTRVPLEDGTPLPPFNVPA